MKGYSLDISQTGFCIHPRDSRDKVNEISGMDHIRKLPLLLVDHKRGRVRGCAVKHFPPPVDRHRQVQPGPAHDITEVIAVHHQKIQGRKGTAAEQLRRPAV